MNKIKISSPDMGSYVIPKSKLAKFKFISRELARTRVSKDWDIIDYNLAMIDDFGILFNKYEFRRGPRMKYYNDLFLKITKNS